MSDAAFAVLLIVCSVGFLCFGAAVESVATRSGYCDGYCTAIGAVCHEPGDPPVCAKVVGEGP